MAFDPRSLERLKELGRTLPKPLPAVAPPSPEPKRASEQRHRVETETDPEALFRELITVSTDGTVPPHLLDRLRQSEQQKLAKPPGPSPLGQRHCHAFPLSDLANWAACCYLCKQLIKAKKKGAITTQRGKGQEV